MLGIGLGDGEVSIKNSFKIVQNSLADNLRLVFPVLDDQYYPELRVFTLPGDAVLELEANLFAIHLHLPLDRFIGTLLNKYSQILLRFRSFTVVHAEPTTE